MGSGGISSLLNISKSSLFAQTQAIRVIGDNIANANVEGYSRRRANIETLTTSADANSISLGSGVNVRTISRLVDKFLSSQIHSATSDRAKSEIRDELLSRAEGPFSLEDTVGQIGFQLSEFFSSLDDLSADPANMSLRQNVIEQGASLSQAIQSSYESIASLQREADNRIGLVIGEVNSMTADIAELNTQISTLEISEQEALALRDKRDQLLKELSEKLSINSVENGDGTVLVSLSNGFTLVNGSSARALDFTASPSFAPVSGYPPGLDNSALRHIVYDYDSSSTTEHIDLTSVIGTAGGELGGLLSLRGIQSDTDTSAFDASGDLVLIGARIEAVARDLLVRFNQTYLGPVDEDPVTAGFQASSVDLNGNNPSPFGLFTVAGASDDDADGLPSIADLQASTSFVGYASAISFNISDPANIAAAIDLDTATSGSTPFGDADNTNIRNLVAQRNVETNYSVGAFSATATLEDLYNTTVTYVGSQASSAATNLAINTTREEQVLALQQNTSGVSLDEEFAQLIKFQRAYEGSARMIQVGDNLLQELVRLLG
ncbi:MAG: flagellar hook-associated protein FlgK [Deltaproteobacteria bacterium]|nr:flagellar hook-associated protein FlgK [Deltaproteobacteria bacterium]